MGHLEEWYTTLTSRPSFCSSEGIIFQSVYYYLHYLLKSIYTCWVHTHRCMQLYTCRKPKEWVIPQSQSYRLRGCWGLGSSSHGCMSGILNQWAVSSFQIFRFYFPTTLHVPESFSTFYMSAMCHARDMAKVRVNYDLNLGGHNGLLWLSISWPVSLEGMKCNPNKVLGQG